MEQQKEEKITDNVKKKYKIKLIRKTKSKNIQSNKLKKN